MLYQFLLNFVDTFTFLNVFKYLTFRSGLSVVTSLIVVFIVGGPLIKIFSKNIYWVIGILIINKKLNIDAEKVMKKLKNYVIGTRPFFWPMHKQKIFKNLKY